MTTVSVVIPCYNSASFVGDALRSVLAQSFTDFEVIIVDDHSTDNSVNIIELLANNDARIKLEKLDKNSGPGYARNKGIALSQGEYVAFLDADDVWQEDKLEKQIEFMRANNALISYTGYAFINSEGAYLRGRVDAQPEMNLDRYMRTTGIGLSTAVIKRELLGRYRFENVPTRQDLLFWLQVFRDNIIAKGINECLVHYRIRPGQISGNKIKIALTTFKFYMQFSHIAWHKRIINYLFYAYNAILKRLMS